MAYEPPVVQGLKVVSGRRLAVARRTAGEEVRTCMQHCRPRRSDSGEDVEQTGERRER